jgi:hypothetical protein
MIVPGLIGPNDPCYDFRDYVEKEFVFRSQTAEHFNSHAIRIGSCNDEFNKLEAQKLRNDKVIEDLRDMIAKVAVDAAEDRNESMRVCSTELLKCKHELTTKNKNAFDLIEKLAYPQDHREFVDLFK